MFVADFLTDRDNRWDRLNLAYKAIIEGTAPQKILLMQLNKVIKKLLMNFLDHLISQIILE